MASSGVLRTGSPWRDLPERYGPHTTIYNRFNRWAKAGVWVQVFERLAENPPTACSSSTVLSSAPGDVVADRSYDARAILDLIAAHGGRGHIPTQRDRKVQRSVDAAIYRKRNLVERFFNKLKHFRKVATRYEKTATNYLAAVLLVSSRLWLRFHEPAS